VQAAFDRERSSENYFSDDRYYSFNRGSVQL
jgi:hypothetical protein